MNVVRVTVENPDELLNAAAFGAGALVRLQTSPTETGSFVNEATAAIVTGTRSYTMYDTDGLTSAWYRTRYENAGGTITSDWSAAFQAGTEEAGGLCSLYDVKQALNETATTYDEELAEAIAEITIDIIGYTERRFVRSPLVGTTTFLFDVDETDTVLRIPQGIATLTLLELATTSQPESGGVYTTATAGDYALRPSAHMRAMGWPATRIVFRDNPVAGNGIFYAGFNTVRITGALGWDKVPPDVSAIARRGVVRRFKNRGAASVNRGGDPTDIFTRWTFSLEEKAKLMAYKATAVG